LDKITLIRLYRLARIRYLQEQKSKPMVPVKQKMFKEKSSWGEIVLAQNNQEENMTVKKKQKKLW